MKKFCLLLLSLFLIFMLSACADNANDASVIDGDTSSNITSSDLDKYFNTFENFEHVFDKIAVKDDNYIIKQSDEHTGDFYWIYDNSGNLLDKGYHGYRGSFDINKKNNLITLEYGFSGTNVFPHYRFYDTKKSKVSRYFAGPVSTSENLVAYFKFNDNGTDSVVVQDIFDVDKFYKEFTGNFDEPNLMRLAEVSFSEDGTKIIVKCYDINNQNNIIEKTFEIK